MAEQLETDKFLVGYFFLNEAVGEKCFNWASFQSQVLTAREMFPCLKYIGNSLVGLVLSVWEPREENHPSIESGENL